MWSGVTSQNYIKRYPAVQSARLFNFPLSTPLSPFGRLGDRFKDRTEKRCKASDIKGKMKKVQNDRERQTGRRTKALWNF